MGVLGYAPRCSGAVRGRMDRVHRRWTHRLKNLTDGQKFEPIAYTETAQNPTLARFLGCVGAYFSQSVVRALAALGNITRFRKVFTAWVALPPPRWFLCIRRLSHSPKELQGFRLGRRPVRALRHFRSLTRP